MFNVPSKASAVECTVEEAVAASLQKENTEPWPAFDVNPYDNQTAESLAEIA